MTNLVYYKNEEEIFKTAFEKKMSINEADIVFLKLVKHFKLGQVYLAWTSGSRKPKASYYPRKVLLNKDWNTFGVLCHELAHIKQMVKGNAGHTWHNKKHLKIMKGMIVYCERKNYFEAELKRRLTPKQPKAEPTQQEFQQQKIVKIEVKIKRYEMKIKMYGKKLSKAKRHLIRLQKRCAFSI
jgi:hypothetical protein